MSMNAAKHWTRDLSQPCGYILGADYQRLLVSIRGPDELIDWSRGGWFYLFDLRLCYEVGLYSELHNCRPLSRSLFVRPWLHTTAIIGTGIPPLWHGAARLGAASHKFCKFASNFLWRKVEQWTTACAWKKFSSGLWLCSQWL